MSSEQPPTSSDQPRGRIGRTTDRIRDEQQRVTERVTATRTRLEEARPRNQAIDTAFRVLERDNSAGGTVLAGAVAFRIFLFIVPYVFTLVVAFGVAGDATTKNAGDLARDAGMGGLVAKAVSQAGGLSGFQRGASLVVGAFATFLAARSFLKVLRVVHAMVWGVRVPKLAHASKAVGVFIALVSFEFAVSVLIDDLRGQSLGLSLVAILLNAAVPLAIWTYVSWWLPHRAERWTDLLPGAALFTAGVTVLHFVTIYWIAYTFESKTDTYGAIGAALAMLLWAYILGRVMAAAAVLNATMWRRRQGLESDSEPAPATQLRRDSSGASVSAHDTSD